MNIQTIFIPNGPHINLYQEVDGNLQYLNGPWLDHEFHVGSYCLMGNHKTYYRTRNITRIESVKKREVDNSIMVKFCTVNSTYVLRLENDSTIQYREDLEDLAIETGMNMGGPEWLDLLLKFKRKVDEEESNSKDKGPEEAGANVD